MPEVCRRDPVGHDRVRDIVAGRFDVATELSSRIDRHMRRLGASSNTFAGKKRFDQNHSGLRFSVVASFAQDLIDLVIVE